MSDFEIPRTPGERTSAFPSVPLDAPAAPAAVAQQPAYFDGSAGATPGSAEDLVRVRYARHGVSPIPWAIASFVAIAVAAWALNWSELSAGATDPVRSSEWWTNITSVLIPVDGVRLASYSEFRMWVALVLLVAAALVLARWVGRIGSNLRSEHSPFGSVLPLLAFPAWWALPITLGTADNGARSPGDLMVRYLVAFAILFAQFLLLRWPVLNRIWRAGHLRYDLGSIVLWLPMLIPWSMIFLSTAYTSFTADDGRVTDSIWRPTVAMYDWARWLTRASNAGILVLLVVVSVAQHIGMQKDRADDAARREAAAADTLPL